MSDTQGNHSVKVLTVSAGDEPSQEFQHRNGQGGPKIYPESPKQQLIVKSPSKTHVSKEETHDKANVEKKVVKISKNYLLMDREELQKIGVRGWRLNLTMLLRTKPYDICMIILIILYTVLIFVYFALESTTNCNAKKNFVFLYIEIAILGIFCLEITVHIIALGNIYMKDLWNVFDLVIIILSVLFVLMDVFVKSKGLQGFLKIRGVFRLLRIFILIRKLNVLKTKREIQKRNRTSLGYDLTSPLEKVLDILNDLKNKLDINEDKPIEDLNYCIKMIQSNKLYEATIDLESQDPKNGQDVALLYNQFSTNNNNERRNSKRPSFQIASPITIDTQQTGVQQVEQNLKLNKETLDELQLVDQLHFDIFKVQNSTQQNELVTVTSFILAKHNIFNRSLLNFDIFLNFMRTIQGGYKDVTYHNKTHAADLSQTFYFFYSTCGLGEKSKIDNVELMSIIIAGACHDYEHPGFNNVFLVESKHEIALRYNDQSVLENHHIAASFLVMQRQQNNILQYLSKDDYKRSRKLMVDCVLGTDMAKHFAELAKFKSRVQAQDYDPSNQDKQLTIGMLFHLADISNSTKPWNVCQQWIDLLFIEFFYQGDLERSAGTPISYLMDRTTVNVAKSQIGFLDVIIGPAYQAAQIVLPGMDINLQNIEDNKNQWTLRFEEYEKKMEKDKEKCQETEEEYKCTPTPVQRQIDPAFDSVNDELTIESMFKVFDKDQGQVIDIREILDLSEKDFSHNQELQKVIKYMNINDPLPADRSPHRYTQNSSGNNSRNAYDTITLLNDQTLKLNYASLTEEQQQMLLQSSWQDWWDVKMKRNMELIKAINDHSVLLVKSLLDENKNLDFAADVNYQFNNDNSPLHYAVLVRDLQIIEILLDNFAEINSQNLAGKTPLHIACEMGEQPIVEYLAKKDEIFIEIEDNNGNSPLHLAAKENHFAIIKYLVDHCSADSTCVNLNSEKPIDLTTDQNIKNYLKEVMEEFQAKKRNEYDQLKKKKGVMRNIIRKTKDIFSSMAGKKRPVTTVDNIIQDQARISENYNKNPRHSQQVFEKKFIPIHEMGSRETSQENVNLKSFNVIERLGKGSFGSVYLVELKSNQKVFAMKVLEKSKILKQNLVRYAMTERNVLCLAKHPFIVSMNYAFQTSQRLYLILDYCPGGDMGLALSRQRRFSEDLAKIYLCEILLALEYLHQNKIVFRDLKPDNVVFDDEGHALLTDFGLSKEGLGGSQQSQSFCGSVAYLAPEMLKRMGHTKSIDWYLLGVLLYEMIVGVPPYFNTDRQKLFENIQTGPLKIPHTMSENARSLILQLLNRNPSKRLGAGPRDSDEIKEHPFFDGVNWDDVIQRKLPVPAPKIRKIEPNPMSIQSFLLDEEKGELDIKEGLQIVDTKQRQSKKNKQPQESQIDPNKIAGWSYIKKK